MLLRDGNVMGFPGCAGFNPSYRSRRTESEQLGVGPGFAVRKACTATQSRRMLGPRSYRNDPRFVRQRLDRVAGLVNDLLIVVAFALGALDLVLAACRVAETLPPLPGAAIAVH